MTLCNVKGVTENSVTPLSIMDPFSKDVPKWLSVPIPGLSESLDAEYWSDSSVKWMSCVKQNAVLVSHPLSPAPLTAFTWFWQGSFCRAHFELF